jgi:hypothetical protein
MTVDICRWVLKIVFRLQPPYETNRKNDASQQAGLDALARRASSGDSCDFKDLASDSRIQSADPMNDDEDRELPAELARLQQEHRDLDAAIDALQHSPAPDLLRLQRLKKRKLHLRDRISFIEDQITPDIIA